MATDRPLTAIALRLAASILIAVMFALAKLLGARGVGLIEMIFFRQAFAVLPVLLLVMIGPGFVSLKTRRLPAHAIRTVVGVTGMTLNFITVGLLPLAEAQTLWFTTPLFATLLSMVLLGERVGWHRWAAVATGFVGVLIVVQPQSGHLPLTGAAVGLAAGLVTGFVSILLRQLGRTEPALTTVFWFTTLSAVPLGLALPWFVHAHDPATWALIVALGVVGGLGQIALTYALQFAPVSVVAPVDYSSLLWSIVLGVLLFGALPTLSTWIGAPVIVASGLYIVWREHRRQRAVMVIAPD